MKITTKPLLIASLIASALGFAPMAYAADAAPAVEAAPASPHTFTSNIGLYTDYVFRGISYTRERGALQGGFDYSHSSGLYLGVWASNVEKSALYGNTMEIDLYGGYAHQFTPDLGINVGVLQFYYPNNNKAGTYPGFQGNGGSANTTELNAAVTYKWLTLKHSVAVSNFFGVNPGYDSTNVTGNSRGSGYTELNFNYQLPVQAINLALHVGHQTVRNVSNGLADYTDFLVGVNKDFEVAGSKGWNAGVNYTTTDASGAWYYDLNGWKTGDDKVIGFIKRTF